MAFGSNDLASDPESREELSAFIAAYSSPFSFSIGLYGEWGSGKTSLLNMVIETVEKENEDAVILRFNPWLCSDPKQLITQFFKQLATAIKMKKPTNDRVWELIDQYADIFGNASLYKYYSECWKFECSRG